jgi:hypothetical protein
VRLQDTQRNAIALKFASPSSPQVTRPPSLWQVTRKEQPVAKRPPSEYVKLWDIVSSADQKIEAMERQIAVLRRDRDAAASKLAKALGPYIGTGSGAARKPAADGAGRGRGKRRRASGAEVQKRLDALVKALEGTTKDKGKSKAELLKATGLAEKYWIPTMQKMAKLKLVKSVGSKRDMRYFVAKPGG